VTGSFWRRTVLHRNFTAQTSCGCWKEAQILQTWTCAVLRSNCELFKLLSATAFLRWTRPCQTVKVQVMHASHGTKPEFCCKESRLTSGTHRQFHVLPTAGPWNVVLHGYPKNSRLLTGVQMCAVCYEIDA